LLEDEARYRSTSRAISALYKGGDRADSIWTGDDIARSEGVALALDPPRPQIVDALRLASLTGLRPDLVSLTWD